ncbi:hypothetical protein IJG76_01400 [Candidatus Saccharibacteria bacterium]|nr:hypothetical protein [Candidatus Saccharibacteria bacterium]
MKTILETLANILLFIFICILYVIIYPLSLIEDLIYKKKSRASEKAEYYHRYL